MWPGPWAVLMKAFFVAESQGNSISPPQAFSSLSQWLPGHDNLFKPVLVGLVFSLHIPLSPTKATVVPVLIYDVQSFIIKDLIKDGG